MIAAAAKTDAFPWDRAMAFGFGALRLSSRDFWALSPRELAAAMRAHVHEPARLAREELDALMARYPD